MSGLLHISEDAGVSTLESAASLIGTVPGDRSGGVLSGGGCTWGREQRAEVKRWEQAWGVARRWEGCP